MLFFVRRYSTATVSFKQAVGGRGGTKHQKTNKKHNNYMTAVAFQSFNMAEGQGARFIPNQKGRQNLVDEQNFKSRKQCKNKDKTSVVYQCVKKIVLKCPAVVEYLKAKETPRA